MSAASASASALYEGVVVHRRLRPIRHVLRYHVFSLLLDCEELPSLDQRLRFFSYNRWNVCSLYDGDHGDGTALVGYLRTVAEKSGQRGIDRFLMLCYPRMFGYGFNPITVYFGIGAEGKPKLIIYEVNNTFGERRSYVIPVGEEPPAATISQSCEKALYVSPFNSVDGRYSFRVTPLGQDFTMGVALENDDGPILKAYFRGTRSTLSDRTMLLAVLRTGWLSVKVIAAIHFEALKLWIKGLRIAKRPNAPRRAMSFVSTSKEHVHS